MGADVRFIDGKDEFSSYVRKTLLSEDNTSVIQGKNERISDLKSQIEGYKKQIEQLHTIILVT